MAFRDEVRAWLLECCPPSLRTPARSEADDVWGGRRAVFPSSDARIWLERMAARGYTAPAWPRDCGGAGLGDDDARVLDEELRALGCRPPLRSLGLWMLGPVLLRYGSEEQKREHLPRIARGEIRWCQGYSEPGAGSDLASLTTRAARDGDVYVVNGQKIWTSHADRADWMFCLVRTGPGREGISFLLIDMETPGISVKPIRLISGASPFCETFFDDVRVPARNLVGREGQGWEIAKALLGEERLAMSRLRDQRTAEEEPLAAAARRYGCEALFADRIARADIDFLACKLTLGRYAEEKRGGADASLLKVVVSETTQRRKQLRVEIAGFQGLGWEGDGFAPDELAATRDWLRTRALSIEGGTTEIQLNILARHVLGLPENQNLNPNSGSVSVAARAARAPWEEQVRLGVPGLVIPEGFGGAGLGFVELGAVLEEHGRQLAQTPLLSTVLCATALLLGDSEEARRRWLPELAAGRVLCWAHDEGPRHARASAARVVDGRLHGDKSFVLDGAAASACVATAAGGVYLVEPGAATPLSLIDGRPAARVRFDGARVLDRLGDVSDAVLDRGAAALAAEMLGGAGEVFERTVAYLKTRRQFGVPIGSFQALQHRAARLHCELELTRSLVLAALRAIDGGDLAAPRLCAAAKARASETYTLAAAEAVQLHGGIGVTDELPIGRHLKRARVAGETLGSASFWRARFAALPDGSLHGS